MDPEWPVLMVDHRSATEWTARLLPGPVSPGSCPAAMNGEGCPRVDGRAMFGGPHIDPSWCRMRLVPRAMCSLPAWRNIRSMRARMGSDT